MEKKKRKITVEVDPEFYHKIKIEIAKRDVTLKQYVTALIEEDLKKKKFNLGGVTNEK